MKIKIIITLFVKLIFLIKICCAQTNMDIQKISGVEKHEQFEQVQSLDFNKPTKGFSTKNSIIESQSNTEINKDFSFFSTSAKEITLEEQFQFSCAVANGEFGIETDGSFIYTTRWSGTEIYVYSLDGEYLGEFSVQGVYQIRDLAYDGEYFYGSNARETLYQMELNGLELSGKLIGTIEAPTEIRAIAYDEDSDAFYANNYESEIILFDREGNILNSFYSGEYSNYNGFAWIVRDGNPYLWGFSTQGENDATLVEMSLPGGEETGVTIDAGGIFNPNETNSAGGLFIHPNLTLGTYTLGGLIQNEIIFGLKLCDADLPPGNDLKLYSIPEPKSDFDLGVENVTIAVQNAGTVEQSNFSVRYRINSGEWVTETVTETIPNGEILTYTFSNQADLSSYGEYNIETEVLLEDDEEEDNNMRQETVVNKDLSTTCNYSVVAYSDGTHGWRDGRLTITQDEKVILNNYTLSSGHGPEVTEIEVATGSPLNVSFKCGYDDCDYCNYKIRDRMNHLFFEDGTDGEEPEGGETDIVSCTPIYKDAKIISLVIPPISNPSSIVPYAVVVNDGYDVITFDVQLNIEGGYSSTHTVADLAYGDTSVVTFDSWNAETGSYNTKAYTLLPDDELTENDTIERDIYIIEEQIFYAYCADDPEGNIEEGPICFNSDDPSMVASISSTSTSEVIAGACWANGQWYASQNNGDLYIIDQISGKMEFVCSSRNFYGIAHDHASNILYGVDGLQLYKIDPTTDSETFIGDLKDEQEGRMVAIACNYDGDIYGIDNVDDNLYSIDPVTGKSKVIGSLGIDLEDYDHQDMAWDKENDILYISAYTSGSGKLYTCNPNNGSCKLVGEFAGGIHVTGLAIPYSGDLYSDDIQVISITSPETGEDLVNEEVTIVIKNNGIDEHENIPVSYSIDGNEPVTEIFTGTLEQGEMAEFTFSVEADLSTWDATYQIEACANIEGDERTENDCKQIEVTNIKPCTVEYPSGATYENENCGESTNNGCNLWSGQSSEDNSYGSISDGETIYGTVWIDADEGVRDCDEYLFTIEESKNVTITCKSEFVNSIYLLGFTNGCDNLEHIEYIYPEKCEEGVISVDLAKPGDYIIHVTPRYDDGSITCDDRNAYWVKLDIQDITYCVDDLYEFGCIYGDGIVYFSLNNVDFDPINCDGAPTYQNDWYHDWTDIAIPVKDQDVASFSIGYSDIGVKAWIDFNNNSLWEENEVVIEDSVYKTVNLIYEAPVSIPEGVADGTYTMRVRTSFGIVGTACETYNYGNTLDFKVLIGNPSISVDAGSLTQSLTPGGSASQTLTISNSSDLIPLTYEIDIDSDDDISNEESNKENTITAIDPALMNGLSTKTIKKSVGELTSSTKSEAVLMYDDGTTSGIMGISVLEYFIVAAHWPEDNMQQYKGMSLTEVEVFTDDVENIDFTLIVWGEGTSSTPGDTLCKQVFSPDSAWNTITLQTPVEIDGKDIWIGYKIEGTGEDQMPVGYDGGPAATGYGDLIYGNGSWTTFTNMGYSRNWNIHAKLEGEAEKVWLTASPSEGTVETGTNEDVTLTFSAEDLEEGTYNTIITIYSNDTVNSSIEIPVVLNVNSTTGIEDLTNDEYILVYPNPGTGIFNIALQSVTGTVSIVIYDLTGKMIYNRENITLWNKEPTQIDLSSYPNGVYLLNIKDSEVNHTRKLIIDK